MVYLTPFGREIGCLFLYDWHGICYSYVGLFYALIGT